MHLLDLRALFWVIIVGDDNQSIDHLGGIHTPAIAIGFKQAIQK